MSLFVLLLSACSACVGLPEEIPAEPGTVSEEDIDDLITVSSPDLALNLWLVTAQLAAEDYRDCPKVYATSSSIFFDAGGAEGCRDSAGVTWVGNASAGVAGSDSIVFSFNDFGPTEGTPSPWRALGTLTATPTTSGAAVRFTTQVEFTSLGPQGERLFYSAVTGTFTTYEAVVYADSFYGQVGMEGWGTAEIDGQRVPLGVANGCAYGAHYSGSISIVGANEAVLSFQNSTAAGAPPPAEGIDTGSAGDTGETGGPGDGVVDGIDTTPPTGDAGGLCGDCVLAAIDGSVGATCYSPDRAVDWPFYAPF